MVRTMDAKLKKTLIKAMDEWTLNECENEGRPNVGLIAPDLHKQMAEAAAAVYDAAFSSQAYQLKES